VRRARVSAHTDRRSYTHVPPLSYGFCWVSSDYRMAFNTWFPFRLFFFARKQFKKKSKFWSVASCTLILQLTDQLTKEKIRQPREREKSDGDYKWYFLYQPTGCRQSLVVYVNCRIVFFATIKNRQTIKTSLMIIYYMFAQHTYTHPHAGKILFTLFCVDNLFELAGKSLKTSLKACSSSRVDMYKSMFHLFDRFPYFRSFLGLRSHCCWLGHLAIIKILSITHSNPDEH
jgi:hypothetical protein